MGEGRVSIGLNVGSGQRRFNTTADVRWVNVDRIYTRRGHEPDIAADGGSLPVGEGVCDWVVLHHVCEHFGCGEARHLLVECHRVLLPGGSLLVFVPDMRAMAQRWLAGMFDTQLYFTSVYGAYLGDEESRHKWGYTHDTLARELSDTCHWTSVQVFNWRQVPGMDAACDWWVLAMEAVK